MRQERREVWIKLIEQWKESRLTAKEFGQAGVNLNTLQSWKWRLTADARRSADSGVRPPGAPATDTVMPINVDKTAFVRFDTNNYSVSPDYAEDTLTLAAADVTVRVLRGGGEEVARHARNWGRRQRIEDH